MVHPTPPGAKQADVCTAAALCLDLTRCFIAMQVKVGDKLPTVELVMPTAASPTPDLFVTTNDLFQGQQLVTFSQPSCCCSERVLLRPPTFCSRIMAVSCAAYA